MLKSVKQRKTKNSCLKNIDSIQLINVKLGAYNLSRLYSSLFKLKVTKFNVPYELTKISSYSLFSC